MICSAWTAHSLNRMATAALTYAAALCAHTLRLPAWGSSKLADCTWTGHCSRSSSTFTPRSHTALPHALSSAASDRTGPAVLVVRAAPASLLCLVHHAAQQSTKLLPDSWRGSCSTPSSACQTTATESGSSAAAAAAGMPPTWQACTGIAAAARMQGCSMRPGCSSGGAWLWSC